MSFTPPRVASFGILDGQKTVSGNRISSRSLLDYSLWCEPKWVGLWQCLQTNETRPRNTHHFSYLFKDPVYWGFVGCRPTTAKTNTIITTSHPLRYQNLNRASSCTRFFALAASEQARQGGDHVLPAGPPSSSLFTPKNAK